MRVNGRTVQSVAQDGRAHIITDEKGSVTRKVYDEKDNLTRIVYPDGTEASYTYEYTFNRRTRAVDENGVVTTFAYDTAGNLTRKVEALGTDAERISEYEYADGNLPPVSG